MKFASVIFLFTLVSLSDVPGSDAQTTPEVTHLNIKSTGALQSRTKRSNPKGPAIRFELSPHYLSAESGSYKDHGPVRLRCAFLNTSKRPTQILLSDHNDYSGTRPFPFGLVARVWDSTGELVTRNKYSPEGWWSSEYGSSAVFFEGPGDRITLKPGEKLIRIVPLDAVLERLETLPDGLKSGRYTVQLMLQDMVSNKIEIVIRPE